MKRLTQHIGSAAFTWRRQITSLTALGIAALIGTANAAIITVTTTDNTSVNGFSNALAVLNDGDTIAFNIPGAGVHTIETPLDGYPLITKNNITIDGYSQPGSLSNSAALHAANNAQLNICLSSVADGYGLSMYHAVTNFAGVDYPNLGFSDDELAILGFFRATNAWVKGIAFLSPPSTLSTYSAGGDAKTICIAPDASDVSSQACQGFHVSGCWFGVNPATRQIAFMPDNTTVATPAICIATYGTGTNGTPASPNITASSSGTVGVAGGSANPHAEFNVFVTGYGFDSQGGPFRVSGNFWNVLPDGVTLADISVLNGGQQQNDAYFEVGGGRNNLVGTDGDGVNDADEGNLFGSYKNGGDYIYFYGGQAGIVIAGNTFGVDINGKSFGVGALSKVVHHFNHDPTCEVRFGSDFNGVSDALEGNTVVDAVLFDIDTTYTTNATWFSVRGNSFTNTTTPYSGGRPPMGDGQTAQDAQNLYSLFIDVSGSTLDIIPVIGAGTTTTSLTGTCGKPLAGSPYSRLIVDLYQADPAAAQPQGMKWLASFTDNAAEDSNPAVGAFTFNTTSLGIAHGTKVTIAVTYSRDLQPTIASIQRTGNQTTLAATGGTGPNGAVPIYDLLQSSLVTGPYAPIAVQTGGSKTFTDNANPNSFYRATGPSASGQTSPFANVFTIP